MMYNGVARLIKNKELKMNEKMLDKMTKSKGFIAALDQSGGSTPKALRNYGVEADAYNSDAEMFDMVHAMRTRIIKSPSFTGERILGAILFEMTMERKVDDLHTAQFLWEKKGIVPFLKIDKGLAEEKDGMQMLKPIPELDAILEKAKKYGIFGTKERSVIKAANPAGIKAIVTQQFDLAKKVIAAGLVPIIEPEVDINISDKKEAEAILKGELLGHLRAMDNSAKVIFKLTLPEESNLYKELTEDPRVIRVVALSGGYTREESNRRLAMNNDVVASFSRALTEGLNQKQTESEFDKMMDESIESIYQASIL